ncbi:MAG: hypothetical protein DHS20C18_44330 [Saprospiraceae bacterium]|nr:MAG: hypothetical protein DHS20C18_44330 [Saprospiraceae bacterium]
MSGQVTSRKELNLNPNITTGISNGLTRIAMPLGVYSNKDEIAYPIANAKEVEDELISILKDIDVIRDKNEWTLPQFAFIIDELDKIEPNSNISIQEKESTNPSLDYSISARDSSRFRQRQEAVASLLANLKGFLNVVRAKFFFIGGREMFDADLADIADRDSFYSSIFNDVIYIESFFKDSTGESGAGGVTQMTENYLCNIILYNLKSVIKTSDNKSNKKNLIALYEKLGIDKNGEFSQKSNYISLLFDAKGNGEYGSKDYSEKVEESNAQKELRSKLNLSYDELKQQAYKVIFTLQNYVIYLNYRSNGTPKKLTALTEQLMRKGPSLANNSNFKFLRDNVVVLHDRNEDPLTTDLSNKLFLKFGFNTQYEIGLTANLYRPYIIANSRHLKSLGDKLLFSSSFIIDHLLKFHSFGFSWRNLELIPEVVLVNREPNLRKFIEDLMRFYSMTYVRDTVSGIFEHRFRSIIRKELIYLSKTSDLSSAAFNFTLDESLSTKRHYKKKLIELREKYHEFSPTTGDNQFVHSLCFLQTILGNLHFYDKEYDEAILYYSESIQSLRLPNAIGGRFITRHQFLLWVRNQLKLGLTLEKIRAFNSAFSLYRTLILDTERYLKMVVSKTAGRLEESEDHRTIQLISMPFVAFLAATEKARNDGITYANLYRNREEFIKTITPLPEHIYVNLKKVDHYRRNFLLADYYNNVGSILFYKNCQYSNFFSERKDEDSKIWWLDSFEEFDGENLIAEQQRKIYDKSTPIREYDFFPSLTPFNYYWNSLYFLVEYHRERIIAVIEEESEIETLINDIATIIGVVNNELIGNRYDSIPLSQNLLALGTGYLLPECVDMISSNRFYYLANVISKIGDSILAGLRRENFIIPKLEFNARDLIDTTKYGDKKRRQNINKFREIVGVSLYQAETVLYIYKLAAALYKRAGQTSFYAFQLKKILYVIKDLIEINKNDKNLGQNLNAFLGASDTDMQFKKIEEIAEVIFKATTWNNEVSNRPQILKYREILGIEKRSRDRELIYHNINNITDNREVVLLVEGIKMKLSICNFKNYLENFIISKSIITSYGSMNNRYLRMLELKYRSERCYFIVKDFLGAKELLREQVWKGEVWTKNTKSFKERMNLFIAKRSLKNLIQAGKDESVSVNDLITFIIREALFCLRELIKMIKLYDPGYVIGYTFIAEAHNRMGDWCHAYDNYKYILTHAINDEGDPKLLECFKKYVNNTLSKTEKVEFADELGKRNISEQYCKEIKEKLNDFQTEIKEILGPESLAYLESKNHYESAIQYYYKVIQMHSDGKAYRDKLHSIYMLEDDYNDNAAHYIIASERLRINTGNIKNKIRQLSKKTEGSKLYDYSSYLSSNKDENPIPNMNTIEKFLKFFEFEI